MTLKVDLPRDLHSAVTSLKKHVSNNPINQEGSAFTVDEMKDFLSYVADMPCSSNSASMLLYAGIAMQSLSRPGQLCEVRRASVSMYPNKQMHEVTDFGPIRMLGVSTVGFKQNEQAEVTHWIQRTRQPKLLDPVFAMAVKAAVDVKQTKAGLTGDLLANMETNILGECKVLH